MAKKKAEFNPAALILSLLFSTFLVLLLWLYFEAEKESKILREKAYYEGQRDAINGDIRIAKATDSTYKWVKSPYDDGTEPLFNPTEKP